jgi:hypothetical protein
MIVTYDKRTSEPHRLFKTRAAVIEFFRNKENDIQYYLVSTFLSGRYMGTLTLRGYLDNND